MEKELPDPTARSSCAGASLSGCLHPTEVVLSSKCSAALNPMKSRYDPALFVKACQTVTVAI